MVPPTSTSRDMSTKIRRTVFVALLLLLAVQGYIVSDVGEPYPAVWAPGFPGGKASTTYVKPSITFVYRDGAQHTISQDQLLEQFPNSHLEFGEGHCQRPGHPETGATRAVDWLTTCRIRPLRKACPFRQAKRYLTS